MNQLILLKNCIWTPVLLQHNDKDVLPLNGYYDKLHTQINRRQQIDQTRIVSTRIVSLSVSRIVDDINYFSCW